MGAASDSNTFAAPYVYTEGPLGFESSAVIAADVPLKSEPRHDAPDVARLSYVTVEHVDPSAFGDWIEVVAATDHRGFVERRFLRGSMDMRAYFTRQDGIWRMTVWIGGD